jgi:cytidine deaminase
MITTEELISLAEHAKRHAYVPYSHFAVGCAMIVDGEPFTGCNIENASFGLTNCAERTAIFKAVSLGKKHIEKIVVTGDTDEPISPCGACRQVMSEFSTAETPVVLVSKDGKTKETTVGELLPYSFNL